MEEKFQHQKVHVLKNNVVRKKVLTYVRKRSVVSCKEV